GVALLVMGIVPDVLRHFGAGGALIPLAVPMALVFGCALGALLIPAFIVLQERTTPASRGRIFGGIFTVINAAVAIPLLLAGVIADVLGVDRVVAALGVLLILLAAGVACGVPQRRGCAASRGDRSRPARCRGERAPHPPGRARLAPPAGRGSETAGIIGHCPAGCA